MNIETIQGMINNSTWTNPENKHVYQFCNGRDLILDGKDHVSYSLNYSENKVVLQLGPKKKYFIEYINDFILSLYNNEEKFVIMPE